MRKEPLVTIFVPVYNGQSYLKQTLLSIQTQTYKNLEVLLVDDSSKDESFAILEDFAQKDNRFTVFRKENGGMVPKSMNYIKPHITGDFFFYSSQDDIFSEGLIEKMVLRQLETEADTVLPDMEFYFENNSTNKKIIGLNGNREVVLSGKEALIESLYWNIHGFALFRSSLIMKEHFPEDAFDSDEYVTRKMFLDSNKVVFSTGLFYYRQDNLEAITKSFSKKNFFRLNTFFKMYDLLKTNKIDNKYVLLSQLTLIKEYLKLNKKYKSFEFSTEEDKKEVHAFLVSLNNQKFTMSFLLEALRTALIKRKIKNILFLLYFIVSNSFKKGFKTST